ncbi:recombinase family protein [Vallitalea pronyensis]|uniref:Recombinase family protein n=1 Tax=Vallitalea pronyensis TaxID=1348613 RepID=A0A8J8SHP2_9FIRM|nr:recombinase family protein [Vallitalea pronyensis]QUI23637.1 recombinase family protein [Vallitalea pronyensis]
MQVIDLRGAVYIRVSTSDQLEFSPDAQKKAILKYAKMHDILVEEKYIYMDEGISGRKAEKRPAFMKMIKKAKEKPKPFDVILVHKFDRFARNREDSVVYKSLLKKKCGIRVISVSEQLEDDKFSIILESMLEAMAEYYSLNLSDEVKKGMSEKARRGGIQTRPPIGYHFVDGHITVNHKEKAIVHYIYKAFVDQETSYVDIAKHLNAMGHRTKNNGMFQSKSIKYILENPFYIGIVRWNRHNRKGELRQEEYWIIATGEHEHIISDELYYQAMERIKTLKQTKRSNRHGQFRHYLSGLIRCAYCHGTMVYKSNGKKHIYFRCRKSANGACEQRKMIRLDTLEYLMTKRLTKDFKDRVLGIKPRDYCNRETMEQLHKSLNRIPLKFKNIKQAYMEGIDSIEEYKENKQTLLDEKEKIKKQIRAYPKVHDKQQHVTLHQLLTQSVKNSSKHNQLYSSFIKKILVDVPKKSIKVYYYYH